MILPSFNPLDAARATTGNFTPVNHGAAGLFNISSQYIVRVWLAVSGGVWTTVAFRYTQTRLTTQNTGVIQPLLPGEPAPTLAVDTDDLISVGTFDFQYSAGSSINPIVIWPIPFAMLRPGFGLVAIQGATGGTIAFNWLVDWVYPKYLLFPEIGDPDIDPKKY